MPDIQRGVFVELLRRTWTYSETSSAAAGTAGRMYPGNFDCEALKKSTGKNSQINRKNCHESSGVIVASRFSVQRRRSRWTIAKSSQSVQGMSASSRTGTKNQNGWR